MREQSFMKAVFHGAIDEDLVFPFPKVGGEDAENLGMLLTEIRRFLDEN